jgi:hypothetical protein
MAGSMALAVNGDTKPGCSARLYRALINLCYVDETIEDEGFPCSWEWLVWAGWVPISFAV